MLLGRCMMDAPLGTLETTSNFQAKIKLGIDIKN
jgi:hypothetical protein